jgi:hypothetical protein
VKGYERRKKKIAQKEREICSTPGGRYETIKTELGEERVFLPSGKGGTSSPIEQQAARLEKLHQGFDYKCVKAIESSLDALPLKNYNPELAKKVRDCILASCIYGKKFVFRYSGIVGISRETFYRERSLFLYLVAKKLDFI